MTASEIALSSNTIVARKARMFSAEGSSDSRDATAPMVAAIFAPGANTGIATPPGPISTRRRTRSG